MNDQKERQNRPAARLAFMNIVSGSPSILCASGRCGKPHPTNLPADKR
jgi:hypothetical protein